MSDYEEITTTFGAASITWSIKTTSTKVGPVFKRMRSVVKLLDQVSSYEELYNVLKLIRPKEYFQIKEVSLNGVEIFLLLKILEDAVVEND